MSVLSPCCPTSSKVARKMIELAEPKPGEVLYDLGSGDGVILIEAAKKELYAVGIELNEDLVKESRKRIKKLGLDHLALVYIGSLLDCDLSKADIITSYLSPLAMRLLKPKLISEIKDGQRIVVHDFTIPDIEPERKKTIITPLSLLQPSPTYWLAPQSPFRRIALYTAENLR